VSCYEKDLISEDTSIQCELCAANCFHPPTHIYRDWIKGAKTAYLANDRGLLSTAFAEDWVIFSLLLPLAIDSPADRNHPLVITHAIGELRRALAEVAPYPEDFNHIIPKLMRNRDETQALASSFQGSLDMLAGYVDWDIFWSHVCRWLFHLHLDGKTAQVMATCFPRGTTLTESA
jgi:hypothetical protein